MSGADRGGRTWVTWFLPAVAGASVGVIVIRHLWPGHITADDIAIIGAGLTLAATGLAFRAAEESRHAAAESRHALQLHFQPGSVRVAFAVRDPDDAAASMLWSAVPSPAPLWVGLIFREDVQATYELEWIETSGRVRTREVVPNGVEQWVRLQGIDAEEDRSGMTPEIVANVPRLTLRCRDRHIGASWHVSKSWPVASQLGSYELIFGLSS